jgi:hypothetical protein
MGGMVKLSGGLYHSPVLRSYPGVSSREPSLLSVGVLMMPRAVGKSQSPLVSSASITSLGGSINVHLLDLASCL